jgi:hypothetical protein
MYPITLFIDIVVERCSVRVLEQVALDLSRVGADIEGSFRLKKVVYIYKLEQNVTQINIREIILEKKERRVLG